MAKETEPIGKCYKCGAMLYASLGLCDSCENEELQADVERLNTIIDHRAEDLEVKAKYKQLQAENKRLKEVARKVALCFPDNIPEGQAELTFNIPAYIIEELKQALENRKGK